MLTWSTRTRSARPRREVFLEQLDSLIPWQGLEERVLPCYPKAGWGRRLYDLSVMLWIHLVQVCYNLSDPAMADLLYEVEAVRRFAGLRFLEAIPDESNIPHLGMKLHLEVDAETRLIHRFTTTSANVHDVTEAHRLLYGGERQLWGDAGYIPVFFPGV